MIYLLSDFFFAEILTGTMDIQGMRKRFVAGRSDQTIVSVSRGRRNSQVRKKNK